MRISDWSADVCSSDLIGSVADADWDAHANVARRIGPVDDLLGHQDLVRDQMLLAFARDDRDRADADLVDRPEALADRDHVARLDRAVHEQDDSGEKIPERLLKPEADGKARSEEHTSELQSLMRIPYAVFCLKQHNSTNRLISPALAQITHQIHHLVR